MTRILVVGDTHIREWSEVHPALLERIRSADIAVHCGDWVGVDAVEGFQRAARRSVIVHGNSDPVELRRSIPYRQVFEVDGLRIGVSHPAWGGPEPELEQLLPDFPADQVGPLDILCYGHIHVPLNVEYGDMRFVNGGQGYPSFRVPGTVAWIETHGDGLYTVEIDEFAPGR